MNNNIQFLIGERVYLRPFEREDLPLAQKWTNNPEIRGRIGSTFPMNKDAAEEWFENMRKDNERIWFSICLQDGRVIGECGLLRIFYPWRTADLTMIIGEEDVWGQGYGSEAVNLLMDYAFGYLNLHRLSIGVVATNEQALKFWEKVGFKREGVQREGYYHNHNYHDFIMMSILESEYWK